MEKFDIIILKKSGYEAFKFLAEYCISKNRYTQILYSPLNLIGRKNISQF